MNTADTATPAVSMRLASFTRDALPDHFRWQVISALRMMWPEDFAGTNCCPTTIFGPDWQSTHVVISAGDSVIAHAGFVLLDLTHCGESYRVAGLGAVVTFPNFRRTGLGTRAVAEATRLIDESEADVAALFCPNHLLRFYGQFGWSNQSEGLTTTGNPQSPTIEPEPRLMRFLSDHGRSGEHSFSTSPWHLSVRW